jgi:sugar phosphate isomerase/epimerase
MMTRREVLSAAVTAGVGAVAAGSAEATVEPPKRGSQARFRVGSCAYSYRDYLKAKTDPMSYEQFLEACAAMDMDGVEMTGYYFPEPIKLADIHRLTRRAFLLGLDVAGTAINTTLSLPPGEDRDKNLAKIRQWIDYASDMGARTLRVFAGSPPQGIDNATGRKWVIECVQECLPKAEEKGVILAMENHGGVVADAAGTLEILEAIHSDWFGLKWDTANYHTADPYGDLAKVAPYAVTTHMKTEIFPGGKSEATDFARILDILRGVHYRGYLLLEYEAAEEPKVAVPRAIAELQRLAGETPLKA